MPLSVIILAAGQGTRMCSSRPKVLHSLAGKPMLQHVLDSSQELHPQQTLVVTGFQSEQIRKTIQHPALQFVEQHPQQGTGHAIAQSLDFLTPGNDLLVLLGDVPMVSVNTLEALLANAKMGAVSLLSFLPQSPSGYGRILRQAGMVVGIVEEQDANAAQKDILEVSTGIMHIAGEQIKMLIDKLDNQNAQSEYYLTDIVKHAVDAGLKVTATLCEDATEVLGVNNQIQLAEAEVYCRHKQATRLMASGVKLYDPDRIDVRGNLQVGDNVEIDINCIFIGEVTLGDDVSIGANCIIENTTIGARSQILPMTSVDCAMIGEDVRIGPFARIRPGTHCDDAVRIGNFVETKAARIGLKSKINHLSYIGDTDMGARVNVGAGTITCNYDGAQKHQTVIEDDVFIGSDSQLIAPLIVARGTTIGAGSTITRDTPADKLTLSRAQQVTLAHWKKPVKK